MGEQSGEQKIIRGGNWFSHPTYCRGALRPSVAPDTRFDYVGFRCAMSFEKEPNEN
ncbi:MAG: SUMF1/EgtB/PvdO family nonheme iron enzyme [Chloroflexi bacterium]|nr:SUMF1/EgtB/PvdO family nonheme iron enzyme [Chloroflexota bacterium]